MKRLQFQGLLAAMAVAATSSVANAQSPYYVNNGLAGSAFPIAQPNQNAVPQYFQTVAAPANGNVNYSLVAQDTGSGLSNGQAGHVHVPAGNYSVPNGGQAGIQNLPTPQYNAPANSYSNTVTASGTVIHSDVPQQNIQPVPMQGYSQPLQGHVSQNQPVYSQAAPTAGCNSCGTGDISYAPAPSYEPAYGQVPSYGMPYAQPAFPVNSVVGLNPYIFGANGLIFNRIDNEHARFASAITAPVSESLSTKDVRFDRTGGYELFGGRYFGCGKYAVIGSYWSLNPGEQMARVDSPVSVDQRTNMPFTTRAKLDPNVYYGLELPTSHLYDRFNATFSQRVRRDQNFQSVEVNLYSFALGGAARAGIAGGCGGLGGGCGSACGSSCGSSCGSTCGSCLTGPTSACGPIYGARCSPLRFSMFGGFRYFQYQDNLEYAASLTDTMYGNTADDVYYRNNVTNDLFGFQLGALANYSCGRRISLTAGSKAGVFGNHVDYDTFAGTGERAATVLSANQYYGQEYDLHSSGTDVAILGEGNLGVAVCLCRGLTANVGYRILGISGVATAPGQIPSDFGLLNDAQKIDRNGSLILHGLTVGGAYNW